MATLFKSFNFMQIYNCEKNAASWGHQQKLFSIFEIYYNLYLFFNFPRIPLADVKSHSFRIFEKW